MARKKFCPMWLNYFAAAALFVAGMSIAIPAQTGEEPFETVPPPLKVLTAAERGQFNAETDPKRRTVLSVEMSVARLTKAEASLEAEDFPAVLKELGSYQAVVSEGIKFLQKNGGDRKTRDNFRRLEMALRAHAPRIESIRRALPSEYADHVGRIARFTRDARAAALDSFFADTVIPGNNSQPTDSLSKPDSSEQTNAIRSQPQQQR